MMRELGRRRENILRQLRRHQKHLAHLELAQRTHEEVLVWLIAHSKSLENVQRDILGLWYGFGPSYQLVTCNSPGKVLLGEEIFNLLGGSLAWAKFAKTRDRLVYDFAVHLRTDMPSSEVDSVYYYTQPKVSERKLVARNGQKKTLPTNQENGFIVPSRYFAWPVSC